jgi:hypothetical protein
MYFCRITGCAARLLGFHYFGIVLDDGRTIAVCPSCYREIKAAS